MTSPKSSWNKAVAAQRTNVQTGVVQSERLPECSKRLVVAQECAEHLIERDLFARKSNEKHCNEMGLG